MTLGTEASQAECIEIIGSLTFGTEASQPECIDISRSVGDTWYRGQSARVYRD